MKVTAWGRHPVIDAAVTSPQNYQSVERLITEGSLIGRGLGRSYGDSSLASTMISSRQLDHLIAFDRASGMLRCQAGVSLEQLLNIIVPAGWFLPVTPGTSRITIGGAIASDVHGKNHHGHGCFSRFVKSVTMVTASHGVLVCSPAQNADLFAATCGGMGLTGFILEAEIQLLKISSAMIDETVIKTRNLDHSLETFAAHADSTYSVAWIDCLSTGQALGRSVIMLGEHSTHGGLDVGKTSRITVPVDFPGFALNPLTTRLFNSLYYARAPRDTTQRKTHFRPYFYPLDSIHQWNRIYGKNGFTQYQFVLPKDDGLRVMREILKLISDSKRGSFLAVLKAMGEANKNPLSFPLEGYTLALDFKIDASLPALLQQLDERVIAAGGRVYLTKDAFLSEASFKKMYPDWETFCEVRKNYGADRCFHSLQSRRLGL